MQRLNKLSSFDYDNIECWQIQEAVNKSQIQATRRHLYGMNSRKEGAEQSSGLIDDLSRLLKPEVLTLKDKKTYFECDQIPADYLHYSNLEIQAKSECCPERDFIVYEAEETNSSLLLRDEHRKPSFEWAETFFTFVGKTIKIYTNDEFEVTHAKLTYYRLPKEIQINGCINPNTGAFYTADQHCEFNDDFAEIIVDGAVAILSGDTESFNQYQRMEQASQKNP